MPLHLVTGYKGEAHITPQNIGAFNAGIIGNGVYLLSNGEQFRCEVTDSNTLNIYDGDIIIQGRHFTLNKGSYEEIKIANGEIDKKRIDLIVIRYTKESATGIEKAEFAVIKGTATTGEATAPEYTTGDILSGNCLLHEVPLYRISFNGLTVGEPEKMIKETIGGYAEHIITGAYIGNEKESQFIELGFTPSAVFVERSNGSTARTAWAGGYGSEFFGGLALKNRSVEFLYNSISYPILSIEENGFNVYFSASIGSGSERGRVESNSKNTFYYIAWR